MIAALIYATFGPFHRSRLESAAELGRKRGNHLVGIEVAGTQSDYYWKRAQGLSDQSLVTLFPDRDYWKLSYIAIRRALHRALDSIAPDVVALTGWGFRESWAGLGWCLRRGVPRVVISDSLPKDHPQRFYKPWLRRVLVNQFQAGLVAGRPHARYLAELGIPFERCFMGCDAVDNDFFAQESRHLRAKRRPRNNTRVLLSCVRLIEEKNVLGMLDMLEQHHRWSWTIAGDGPQRPEIERRIAALGLQDRVRLLGNVDYDQLPQVYAQSDVYLQPSISDTWGLAVNEAMASGLPVLVSNRCGCHEDMVQQGVNGFIFDPAVPESLGKALHSLEDSEERWHEMGETSREIVSQWGLDLFARSFWQACDAASRPLSRGSGIRAMSKILRLAL